MLQNIKKLLYQTAAFLFPVMNRAGVALTFSNVHAATIVQPALFRQLPSNALWQFFFPVVRALHHVRFALLNGIHHLR
jgi:hypothetical protein